MDIFNLILLGLSGLAIVFAGANRLFRPLTSFCVQTYAAAHADELAADTDMHNEMRGAGANLLFGGLVLIGGAAIPALRPTAFAVGIVIFVGFAFGRLVSLAKEGKPNKDLMTGLITEVLFGTLHAVSLAMYLIQTGAP